MSTRPASPDRDVPQVALITGAARRVGATIARTLHEAGLSVAVHYRSSEREARALVDELCATRPRSALAIRADLLESEATLRGLVTRVVDGLGRLDVLVNNASTFYPTPIDAVNEAQWQDLMGSNLKAPLFLSAAAAPELRRRAGCIVNLTDIHARHPIADHPIYVAAKAGLEALTRALARDLAPSVRVNAVAPGAVLWAERERCDAYHRAVIEDTELKRLGSPEDIARAVLFLVRDAPYVTGQILSVDGGRTLAP